ncbi:Hypothetical_protein [Hexamita inflata]|uniref:Hypothetical_protein n=1 Tax=Hexamita inflata TaxID=28002 RepID=A0AA86UBE3_9EUKA|nr:Hypothetical protein HINF_LOCUS33481 [Hexamita inflata]
MIYAACPRVFGLLRRGGSHEAIAAQRHDFPARGGPDSISCRNGSQLKRCSRTRLPARKRSRQRLLHARQRRPRPGADTAGANLPSRNIRFARHPVYQRTSWSNADFVGDEAASQIRE